MNDPRPHPTPARRTLVALHCSGASGRAFAAYPALLGPDTALCAPDLLGYGEAPWLADRGASLDDEAAHLDRWIATDPRGVHLLGHSFGGAVALQAALRWPQQVLSLTLYEPVRFALLRRDPSHWAAITGVGRRIAALTRAGHGHAAGRLFIDYWARPGAWDALPPERQAAVAGRMPKVRSEFGALFDDPLPPAAFAALPMPVTVLVGGRSPAPARRVAERLAQACPHARLVHLPDCGHMGALERPQAVVQALPWSAPVSRKAA
jgi:pimeloyl-ACP methyl ester carboxylesterase